MVRMTGPILAAASLALGALTLAGCDRTGDNAAITDKDAERLPHLPILGSGAPPTHALVRVAAVGAYRSAAPPEEPVALVAVADEDRASLRSR